ncbi:MAG TPA: hypothetical protein VHX42_01300 [Candidatus Babeliales bacterium]|jgi:hypothetical protein|nr:hypothetical protein [Candidatus Babeliales bacterium]
MNKKSLLLTALVAIAATQTALPVVYETNNPLQQKGWAGLCKSYATSLISGGIIGYVTGSSSAYAISKSLASVGLFADYKNASTAVFGVIIPVAVLITECQFRLRLIEELKQSFYENNINHKKNFTDDAAQLASWIAFLSSPLFNQNVCL